MQAFTVSAAARLCGVDRRTLQRAIQAGRLPLDAQHCLSREALIAAGYLDAVTPHGMPQSTPHEPSQDMPQSTPQDMPQELVQASALLALLERLTTAITDLHEEVRSLREDLRQLPQRTPQERRRGAPTAPHDTPYDTPHAAPPVPQGSPQEVRHAAAAPQVNPATPTRPHGLPPQTLQAIADERTRCEGLSLRDFAQRLHDKGIYSATAKDGTRGPANPGNVQRWLDQARRAGLL
jgi:hypothetical protein